METTNRLIQVLIGTAILFTSLSFNFNSNSPDEYYDITVKFTNIRNSKGRIQLQFYRSQTHFANENPWKTIQIEKTGMKNNSFSYKIENIPAGNYGICILDDENENKKMDYSFMMPTEGFGFSDYYHTAWSKPKYEDFKFNLHANKDIVIKVRYV